MTGGVVEVLGHEIGAVPAAVLFAVSAGGVIVMVRLALTWVYGVAISLALRHAVYMVIASTGIGIEALVEGGLLEFLPAAVAWVLDVVGVDPPGFLALAVLAVP